MSRQTKENGTAYIETILIIPLLLGILYGSIQISFLILSKRITQWACFRATRLLLPMADYQSRAPVALQKAKQILKQIPFQKMEPRIHMVNRSHEVTVSISQKIILLGRSYDVKEIFTLYR